MGIRVGSPDKRGLGHPAEFAECRAQLARGLADPVLVLNERESHVTLASGTEPHPGESATFASFTRCLQNSTEPMCRYGSGIFAQANIVPRGGGMSQPARNRPRTSTSRRFW